MLATKLPLVISMVAAAAVLRILVAMDSRRQRQRDHGVVVDENYRPSIFLNVIAHSALERDVKSSMLCKRRFARAWSGL
jgi:hypothetical protein